MKTSPNPDQQSESEPLSPEQEAAAKAAGIWVGHFARTLKTCRLYDGGNPTVVKFKLDLASKLTQLLEEHGALCLSFTAEDVFCEGVSLYPAKSRDDNLAFAFYRDGIRTLTLSPGIEARELEALIDGMLLVTGQNLEHNDLVTLLWEAHLPHLDVDFVPGEPEMGSGPAEGEEGVPWPTFADSSSDESPTGQGPPSDSSVTEDDAPSADGRVARSDDWTVGERTAEIEAAYEELKALSSTEIERFQREFAAEHEVPIVSVATSVIRAYLASTPNADDLNEIARFLPRVLRQAFAQGSWSEAAEILTLLESGPKSDWSRQTFAQELLQPISVSSVRELLEGQEPAEVADFVEFVRYLGEPSVDLLNLVLADANGSRHQKQISDAIVDMCRINPERLAPWLSDTRWFVVRNVIQILGAIGGDAIAGLLTPLTGHSEARVRLEVIAALRNVRPALARPLLMEMLGEGDTRMFCSVLQQISQERDATTAQILLSMMFDEEFEKRVPEEKRAIYSALSSAGGDEVVAELDAEIHKGNWFTRTQEAHRQAVARCLARIGSPLAKEALERGAESKRAPVRKACEDALVRFGNRE